MVGGQFALGPILLFVYTEPTLAGDTALWEELASGEDAVDAVLIRVAESTGATLPFSWQRRTFGALLYAGWEAAKQEGPARHELVDAMTSLTHGVFVESAPA
ncbi:hypothetical protein [Nocardia acidivorans]|uniref:hypothetical protein n=1 Tax=Nocardia acidivorans TaxID=404580 RepID=UPI000834B9AF|nr:hypothetical protein [Nocardia acidivorans]